MNAALTEDETFSEWISARTPAGRWGSTQDLIGPTTWLCSPDADFVNGHILVVDGGLSAVI
jgi:gluconate 5-dehydrogenase